MTVIVCPQCGRQIDKPPGAVNRARAAGLLIYCDRLCAGFGRRKNKSAEQKREEKALYDARRRIEMRAELKAAKAEYYRLHHDREKEAAIRKKRMPKHVEYCRQPSYRARKSAYDLDRRSAEYGEFAEAYKLLLEVNREVSSRMTRTEIYAANGTINKRLQRKRAYG